MTPKLCWILIFIYLELIVVSSVVAKRSRRVEEVTCNSSEDFYYYFTECDAGRGRWRVSLPSSPACQGINPPSLPKRINECYKSCEYGQFLNLDKVECEDCDPGTYSLGGVLRFDEWDPLPTGFQVRAEKFQSVFSTFTRQYGGLNCSKSKGDVILSYGGPCVSSLIYSADLVKPGSLKFTYQYADDSVLFQFQANSDQCQSLREAEGSRWPPLTGEGVWRTEEILLRTGHNIFQWKTTGIDSHQPKPVLIKRIEIEGVGYTSTCLPCPGGTWSDQPAAKDCKTCPKNTFTHRNSTKCMACNPNEYSEPGSTSCKQRPLCSSADYYQLNTPCNHKNQVGYGVVRTKVIYKWIEPKICLDGIGATTLPLDEEFQECPPCNPGTEYREGRCVSCPGNTFSDGLTPCQECPINTAPDRSQQLTQWFTWPDNLHGTCISTEETGCSQSPAWQLNGDHVQSGKGHADWVYLVMTITVDGFRGIGGMINGQLIEVGRLIFTFEVTCLRDCELLLMQGTSTKNATVIQRWVGSQRRQQFTHSILKNDSYSFSWAFQKVGWDSPLNGQSSGNGDSQPIRGEWNEHETNQWALRDGNMEDQAVVRIFSINITNTIDGGASSCVQCQDGFVSSIEQDNRDSKDNKNSCITCSAGFFRSTVKTTENGTSKDVARCFACPKNGVTVGPFATSCTYCGPALISKDGLTCTTDCLVQISGYSYDLRPLQGFHTIRGTPLFTSSGTQYYHAYNISFCTETKAQCYKNVSLPRGFESQPQNPRVEALICQSTLFPPNVGIGLESGGNDGGLGIRPLSTHAGSLGDHLIGISHAPSILGLSVAPAIRDQLDFPHQFHFFYSTSEPTPACAKGRSTTITFRCRMPTASWSGIHSDSPGFEDTDIKIPEKCADGTCDGCNYHFIWETPFACHLCSEEELTIVRGECKDGFQELHYLSTPNSLCLLKYNSSWPRTVKCTNRLPFVIQIGIELALALTILLSVLLCCFWRRHRKLEYKYMKLVASSHLDGISSSGMGDSIHGERDLLPVAESCALDPDDDMDDDEEESLYSNDHPPAGRIRMSHIKEVTIHSDGPLRNLVTKFSVFNKFKSLKRKEDPCNMEIMNLTEKEMLT